ncbi:MAG: ComF family protein [Proteobacteria bacterium]|nr:ComF family protein [Pseudomonadota bacterium]
MFGVRNRSHRTPLGICRAFLDAVFPPSCVVCGRYYRFDPADKGGNLSTFHQVAAPFICGSCRSEIVRIDSPVCIQCGLPFISRQGEDHLCGDCIKTKKHFRTARAQAVYDGALVKAIHIFKYGKKTRLAEPLGLLVCETFFRFWDRESIDLIIPVPLHIQRLRQRGFNQAALLCSRWADRNGITYDARVLKRQKKTLPQTTLTKKERRKNIRGAFALRFPQRVKGKRILLVDDVYTTGSTVNECARVLKRGKASAVDVLTLVRAVDRL